MEMACFGAWAGAFSRAVAVTVVALRAFIRAVAVTVVVPRGSVHSATCVVCGPWLSAHFVFAGSLFA